MAAAAVRAAALVLLAVVAPAFALPLSAFGLGGEAPGFALASLALALALLLSLPSVALLLFAALGLPAAAMLALSLPVLALFSRLTGRLSFVGFPGLPSGRPMAGAGLVAIRRLEGKDSLGIRGASLREPLGLVPALPPSLRTARLLGSRARILALGAAVVMARASGHALRRRSGALVPVFGTLFHVVLLSFLALRGPHAFLSHGTFTCRKRRRFRPNDGSGHSLTGGLASIA